MSLADLIFALRDPARWRMLAELVSGEPRSNQELAKIAGVSASAGSKHIDALRYTGVVVKKHGVNFLADEYRPAAGTHEIDLGGCVLRLGDVKWLNS